LIEIPLRSPNKRKPRPENMNTIVTSPRDGLAPGQWRALSVREEVSDARPEEALHP
jgi:hypothetical protein